MKHRSLWRRSGQAGFTLIELVVAIGVATLVMSAASAAIYQILAGNARDTAHMKAVKQVENALHFMVRDIQMAQPRFTQTDNLTGDEVLRLGWVEWDNTVNQVTYSVTGGDVTRTHSADGQTNVAHYIATLDPQIDGDGNVVVTIVSTITGRWSATESRTVEIVPRSGS